MITIEDFQKLDIRIGKVLSAEKVKGADKLIKLEIDFGAEKRQVVTGMAEFFAPDYFVGKQIPVIVNLEPRTLKGIESQGMVLSVNTGEELVFLQPEKEVPLGGIIG